VRLCVLQAAWLVAAAATPRAYALAPQAPQPAVNPGGEGARLYVLPPAEPSAAEPSLQDIRVSRFVFRGNRVLRASALQAAAVPYRDRNLSAADLEDLRIALTHCYTDRGYINSGVILDPKVPFQDGTLTFLVIEGKVQKVRVRGNRRLRPSYVEQRLRPDPDETLNVNVLRERFQRLLDDPLFSRINSRIEPGADLGQAVLDVEVERARPYALAVSLNNYRPPSIGEKAYDVSGQVRNLTGLGDALDADVNGALEGSGGVGYGLDWQMPVTYHGTFVVLNASSGQTVITTEPLASLDIRSTVERYEVRVIQTLVLSPNQQLNLGLGFAREKNWTTLAGQEFAFLPGSDDGTTRANVARLVPDYFIRTERQFFETRVTVLYAYLLDYSPGVVAYAKPPRDYVVTTAQLRHVLALAPLPFELETHATLQRTNDVISDLHTLEIGGINSVRGFEEDEVLASNVDDLNIDFRWIALPHSSGARPAVTLGPFFDWAEGHDVGGPKDTFSSCGGTLRLKWSHVQADLAGGIRLIYPDFVRSQHGSLQDHGIYLQLTATL
jgi:hemolysin activation/secretion protein